MKVMILGGKRDGEWMHLPSSLRFVRFATAPDPAVAFEGDPAETVSINYIERQVRALFVPGKGVIQTIIGPDLTPEQEEAIVKAYTPPA